MKRIFFALFLLVLASLKGASQDNMKLAKTAESLMVDAVQCYDDGDYAAAKARLSVVMDADPDNDAAYYYMALCDFYLGNAKDAETELSEAARLAPDNYWYRDRLAVLYSLTGREDLATQAYESLLKDFPKKTEIYYNLVNLYANQGRLDEVIRTLDSIEAITGKDESTTLARYDILMHQDKAEEAYNVLAAFNEDYSSPQILSMMADSRLTEDDDSLALALYNEALALDREYAPAIIGKSEVYRMNRSYDEYFETVGFFCSSPAIAPAMKNQYLSSLMQHVDPRFAQTYQARLDSVYDTALAAHPTDSLLMVTNGTYYYRTERPDKAKAIFKQNADLWPASFAATATYLQILGYDKDWAALAEESGKAFERFPQSPDLLDMEMLAHYNLKDYPTAIADCERMIMLFPSDSATVLQAYSTIGDLQHELGDSRAAYKAYDKALKINRNYAPVLNNYAYYLSQEHRKLSKAYSMSRITIEQEPDNPTYLDTFAWILHLQGKDLEAKSIFKHAMLYGAKESPTVLDHYATVLYSLKEYDLAKVYWDMAIKKDNDGEVPGLEARVNSLMDAVK